MKRIIFSITILFILFTNCTGLAIKKEIISNYYLIAVDVDENIELSYCESEKEDSYGTIVSATVIAIGFNDKFIIVKQKPQQMVWGGNKNAINYFIIPIYKDFTYSPEKGAIGPLTLNQFETKLKELKISNLTFDKSIEDFR